MFGLGIPALVIDDNKSSESVRRRRRRGGRGGGGGGATAASRRGRRRAAAGGGGQAAAVARAAIAEGKQIFTQSCGTCHTLADAGTNGQVGPNLDQLKPDKARC